MWESCSEREGMLTALCHHLFGSCGHVVRPVPSALQIKVLWQGRSPEWDEMDGGAFAKWMQACEEEESQQRQIAAALGVKAAASIASDSSQALSGLRPQASTIEAESLQWTCFCFCWPVHLTRSQTHPFK